MGKLWTSLKVNGGLCIKDEHHSLDFILRELDKRINYLHSAQFEVRSTKWDESQSFTLKPGRDGVFSVDNIVVDAPPFRYQDNSSHSLRVIYHIPRHLDVEYKKY
jgi:hypothetical protein